jgi:hypothetical protein
MHHVPAGTSTYSRRIWLLRAYPWIERLRFSSSEGSRRENSISPNRLERWSMRTRGNEVFARVPRRSCGEGLFRVPRLEELVADPDKVGVLDAHTTRVLRTQAIAALNVLNAHDLDLIWRELRTVQGRGKERLLCVKEAAEKFGVTADWLYRHREEFAFTVRHGRLLRFSELGMEQHIRKRRS